MVIGPVTPPQQEVKLKRDIEEGIPQQALKPDFINLYLQIT